MSVNIYLSLYISNHFHYLSRKHVHHNVIIGAKDIIEQTELSDSTVRRILRKFLQDKKIETTDSHYKSPNKKYKLTEWWQRCDRALNNKLDNEKELNDVIRKMKKQKQLD